MTDPAIASPQSHKINQVIDKLRTLTQINVQNRWRCCGQDLPITSATQPQQWNEWPNAQLNPKEYIVWPAGRQVMWLGQHLVVPENLGGYPLAGLSLRLDLIWWAEYAQIYVNGQLVQEGDLFDSSARVLLKEVVVPGEEIAIALRLVSPGHDIGGLMRSCCLYESSDSIDPGFVADELAVLQKYLQAFEPEKLDNLAAAIAEINWDVVTQQTAFTRVLSTLRQHLQSQIPNPKSQIHLLGHAHLDMAWLWTVSETYEVAQRTFESVLKLQQEFPNLTFCHSTPALYAWIEQNRPDLFAAIKQQIAAGRWEVVGGMWVEPDLNLINAESIVRQILYAQRYVQEKFGHLTTVAWVPDSFGFCWQLPQFLKQGGIEYFVTQKLHWNDTSKFPYGAFWWQSPDGSQIFSLMSPPNTTGVMDTNPLKMASYAIEWELQTDLKDAFWLPGVGDHGGGPTRDMLQVQERWQQSPFFPRLEFTTAKAYLQHIQAQLATKQDNIFSDQLPITNYPLPIPHWNDELYLEFHRGCYTTHADQKRWNRRCEGLLYEAELFASFATLTTGCTYPQVELEEAWKKVLFNQFHDILPGTSIPEVFVEANIAWQEVEQVGLKIVEESLNAIASQISLPPPPQPDAQPIIVFNPLNWQRSEVVSVSLPEIGRNNDSGIVHRGCVQSLFFTNHGGPENTEERIRGREIGRVFDFDDSLKTDPTEDGIGDWEIYDFSGDKVPSQITEDLMLLFLAKDIPSVGYRVFWLWQVPITNSQLPITHYPLPITHYPLPITHYPEDFVLENELLRVVVDPDTGNLSSVFDKIYQREVLSGAGNQLQAFQDKGQYWDAWNIDPNYAQHPLPPTQLQSIQWIEVGKLRSRVRVVRQLGQSLFCQDYILDAQSPLLKIATTVDWQERHVLVKAAFPLTVEANYATYEIPAGGIERSTLPQTAHQIAKWELPALHWADLTDLSLGVTKHSKSIPDSTENTAIPKLKTQNPNGYGVSLLNDCKYGYDCQPSQLRLTLLRSPSWPDAEADRGIHQFTYALYPHSGSWQSAGTVQRGYELNFPLKVGLYGDTSQKTDLKPLQPIGRFLDLQSPHLVLMAFKLSEDASNQWILRCYECHGESASLSFDSDLGLAIAHPVDFLERATQTCESVPGRLSFCVPPWKIVSFALTPTSDPDQ